MGHETLAEAHYYGQNPKPEGCLIAVKVQIHRLDPGLVRLERLLFSLELGDECLQTAAALDRLCRARFLVNISKLISNNKKYLIGSPQIN